MFHCSFTVNCGTILFIAGLQTVLKSSQRPVDATCRICQKIFSCRSALNLHMRIHSGVKPFKCDYCQKSFYRKDHWQKHRLSVHEKGFYEELLNLEEKQ